jgi:DNA (cytosine-5)-methyltransferase 1
MENVSALCHRGLAECLGDLAAMRYDAEWAVIPAYLVGARHRRDRVWFVAYPDSQGLQGRPRPTLSGREIADGHVRSSHWWTTEPAIHRVANGIPRRVDRLKALGNAVVPQIPELIGHAIMEAEHGY